MAGIFFMVVAIPCVILFVVLLSLDSDPDFKKKRQLEDYKHEVRWFARKDKKKLNELFTKYEATWAVRNNNPFAPQAPTLYRGVVKGSIADQLAEINNRQKIEKYNEELNYYKSEKNYAAASAAYFDAAKKTLESLKNNIYGIIDKYPKNEEAKITLDKYFDLVEGKTSV